MSSAKTHAVSFAVGRYRRRGWASAVAAVVLLGGGLGQRWLDRLLVAADAVPVALARPLSSLPMQIGPWRGTDVPMSRRVIEVAGNDDQVYRRYVNEETREVVDFYLAFAARPAKMLSHRPQVCYPAHGWAPAGEPRGDRVTTADGTAIECLIHRFARQQPTAEAVVVLNYYIIGGRYATEWTEFWGPRWRLPNLSRDPTVYVAQVQVTCGMSDGSRNASAEDLVKRFAGEIGANVAAMLPRTTAEDR